MTDDGSGSGVDSWYVAFRNPTQPGRVYVRTTSKFRTEFEAKRFASDRLADGCDVSAGTLNPHQPRRTVGPSQILSWLESDQQSLASDHRMLKQTLQRE